MNRAPVVDARVRRKAVWGGEVGRIARLVAVVTLTVISASCGDMTRQGTGSSYLIVTELQAASGAEPDTFGGTLYSDVITVVEDVPTIFPDLAQATFELGMKDVATQPTTNNAITLNRYRVRYTRADGRNTPGVDVPYGFDGAFTGTVLPGGDFTASFELVRHIAKKEAPLRALARNSVIIAAIAEVTFYGRDQTGRDVSVTTQMTVEFGDFGDPD